MRKEFKEFKVHPDRKVLRGRRAILARQDQPDRQAPLARLDRWDRKAILARQDQADRQAPLARQDRRDRKARLELMEQQDRKGRQAPPARKARMVPRGLKDPRAIRD